MYANCLAIIYFIIYSYCIIVDPELPLKDYELQRNADKIVDIWKMLGVVLGLKLSTLNDIELRNPNNNERAALQMLTKWKKVKNNPPQKVLHQAIEDCKAQGNKDVFIYNK